MYAIVDIETTGGFAASHRITEIAIYFHDGENLKNSYQTLVNPEMPIPDYITGLTGISDHMVADAPKFAEIADDVFDLLKGKVFVAHNVHFDYSFIKKEFELLGKTISHKKLCTVRLSRKILPGLKSYGLGSLSKHLDVEIKNRHRAAGDAEATAHIFHYLLNKDKKNFIANFLNKNSGESLLPPNLPKNEYYDLPESPGVYYFMDQHAKVIYVGKAINIKKRIHGHFSASSGTWSNSNIKKEIHHITYELTGNELIALLLENQEIKRLWPKYNAAQKYFSGKWGVFSYEDQNGYLRLNIGKVNKSMKPIIAMFTHTDLWHFMIDKIKEFDLCPRLAGIQKSNDACFDLKKGTCKGACTGDESPEDYNIRVREMIDSYRSEQLNFAILGAGRTEEEASFAYVDNGKYMGIGFIDNNLAVEHIEQLSDYLQPHFENPYSLAVMQSFAFRKGYRLLGNLASSQEK